MKKIILPIIIAAVAVIMLTSCAAGANEEYIRIHIRANSNAEIDQMVKLAVRDRVVDYLTPLASSVSSKSEMWQVIKGNKAQLKAIADNTLAECGFGYTASIKLGEDNFPTREYGELTLSAGVYDAIIIELGTGKGDNWWCVAFPPLCFIAAQNDGTEEVKYRSWIAELFDK